MNKRVKQTMILDGKRPEKIVHLADDCMEKLASEDITLDEAKAIVNRMAHIIERSERYEPKTLLRDIQLRGSDSSLIEEKYP